MKNILVWNKGILYSTTGAIPGWLHLLSGCNIIPETRLLCSVNKIRITKCAKRDTLDEPEAWTAHSDRFGLLLCRSLVRNPTSHYMIECNL